VLFRSGVENGLIERSPQASQPEGIYIARTLVTDCERVQVRVLNATYRDQKLTRGYQIAQCEPVTLVTTHDLDQPRAQKCSSKLRDIKEAAKQNLSEEEFRELKKLLAECDDIFAVDSEDHGRTNQVYHRIDTGDARPIRQPPRSVPLAKQAEVSDMLDDMKRRGVIEESDSPWSSPVVVVRKKNGELYRKLYDVTRKDSFPLPRIDDTLDFQPLARRYMSENRTFHNHRFEKNYLFK
jgi:hypothetical protein